MKQRLLILAAALMMVLGSYAQAAGEYFYTKDGRYKVTTGENLLSNGDFSNGMTDWTTDGGKPLNTDTFAVENDAAAGFKYLRVYLKESGSFGTGSSLLRSVAVQSDRSYVISYQVKVAEYDGGNGASSVSLADATKNYQNFLFSTSGNVQDAGNISLGAAQTYTDEWVTVTYAFTPQSDGYVLLHFFAPYVNTCFANFKIMEARQVPDDRDAARIIAYLQTYLDNPLLPNGHADLEDFIGYIQGTAGGDDLDEFNSALEGVDEAISTFLDANTGNVAGYVKNFTLDDLAATSANQRKAGAWIIDDATSATGKTRWSIKSVLETGAPFNGMYLQDDMPLSSSTARLPQATVYQEVENMPAGKYLFSVKARAWLYKNKQNDIVDGAEIRGIKMFVGSSEQELYPNTVEKATSYYVIGDVGEDGKARFGVNVPGATFSRLDLDFTELRIIGWTQEQVDEFFGGKEFAEAKKALQETVNSAKELSNSNLYKYGFADLQTAIETAEAAHSNASNAEDANNAKTALDEAVTAFKKLNTRYTSIINTIAKAEALVGDETTAAANALRAAITAVKAYVAALNDEQSVETDQALLAQETTLNQAINAYGMESLTADEKYLFAEWAAADGAAYESSINPDRDDPVTTSSGTEMFVEKAPFGGQSLNGRFAFSGNSNLTKTLNASHGLQITFGGKNSTVWSIQNLKAGDQVTIDYTASGLYVTSANAWWRNNDGTVQTATTGGKVAANQLTVSNTEGIGGKTRVDFRMTSDGSLDFYFGSSNVTMRVAYVGITEAAHVVGIKNVNGNDNGNANAIYDLQGRRLTGKPATGLYIQGGKVFNVK